MYKPRLTFHIPLAESSVKLPADFDLQTARQKIQASIDSTYPAVQVNEGYGSWNDVIQLTLSSVTWNNNGDLWQCTWELSESDQITLGQRERVKVTYVTAEAAAGLHLQDNFTGALTEASTEDDGWTWKIQIMQSGRTLTANAKLDAYGLPGKSGFKNYFAEAVKSAAPLFENAPFIVRSEKDHLAVANSRTATMAPNEETRRMGGIIQNVHVAEAADRTALLAQLTLRDNPPGRAMREQLLAESRQPGGVNYGVSYTGFGNCYVEDIDSTTPTLCVTEIVQVDSVDPCLTGNAGGKIIAAAEAAIAESASHSIPTKTPMGLKPKKAAKKPNGKAVNLVAAKHKMMFKAAEAGVDTEEAPTDGGSMGTSLLDFASNFIWKNLPGIQDIYDSVDDVKALDEAKLVILFQKADEAADAAGGTDDDDTVTTDPTPIAESAQVKGLVGQVKLLLDSNKKNLIEARLATIGSGLGEDARQRIRDEFKLAESVEQSDVDTSIRSMKKLLGGASTALAFSESLDFQQGESEYDKQRKGVMAFMFRGASPQVLAEAAKDLGFNPAARENKMWDSFKDMYLSCIGATGLTNASGFGSGARGVHGGALAESASAGILTQLIQDAMHHRMLNEYRNEGEWDFYKLISKPVPVTDFRAYHDQNFGYSSDPMAVIQEDSDYPEIPLTGAEDVSTTLVERGGIFGIGWRAVLNDDVGFVIKIAPRLALGAKKQLAKGVGNLLVNAFSTNFGPDSLPIIDDTGSSTPGAATGAHANYLGKSAISTAGQMQLAARLLAEQPELGGGDAMGLTPDYLLFAPYELTNAYKVLTPGQGQLTAGNAIGVNGLLVATADQSIGLRGIKVPYWTKNTNAYFVMPSPEKIECLHVLYLNGQEEPQIYQEVLNSGLSFSKKRMQMRFEHHWQSNTVDFRGITGGHVS